MSYLGRANYRSLSKALLVGAVIVVNYSGYQGSFGQSSSLATPAVQEQTSVFQWQLVPQVETDKVSLSVPPESLLSWRDLPEPSAKSDAADEADSANFHWKPIEQPHKRPQATYRFDHALPFPAESSSAKQSWASSIPWNVSQQKGRKQQDDVNLANGYSLATGDDRSIGQPEAIPMQIPIQTASFTPVEDLRNSPVKEAVDLQATLEDQRANLTETAGLETVTPVESDPQTSIEPRKSVTEFDTANYTGPMKEATSLFANLEIKNDYRQVAQATAEPVRSSRLEDGTLSFWTLHPFTWASPSFYHRPLYFEQVNLERYGKGPRCCLQPTYSSLHFFGSIAVLPYKLMTQHPHERAFTLGHHRPGDCVPYQRRSWLGQSSLGETMLYWDESSGYQ